MPKHGARNTGNGEAGRVSVPWSGLCRLLPSRLGCWEPQRLPSVSLQLCPFSFLTSIMENSKEAHKWRKWQEPPALAQLAVHIVGPPYFFSNCPVSYSSCSAGDVHTNPFIPSINIPVRYSKSNLNPHDRTPKMMSSIVHYAAVLK